MTRNSPPKLGGEPARTKSEQAGWFPCRYWQLREPPCPRLRSGTPPNLGGECPHSNSFTAPMTADNTPICEIAGGHRRHRPPLQWLYSTFCAKPLLAEEGWRDSRRLTRRGGQFGETFLPGFDEPSPCRARASRSPLRGAKFSGHRILRKQFHNVVRETVIEKLLEAPGEL